MKPSPARIILPRGSNLPVSRADAERADQESFEPVAISNLLKEAAKRGDEALADAITPDAYTGLGMKELAKLTLDRVSLSDATMKVIEAKTFSGNRVIPIYSKPEPGIQRLVGQRLERRFNLDAELQGDRTDKYPGV